MVTNEQRLELEAQLISLRRQRNNEENAEVRNTLMLQVNQLKGYITGMGYTVINGVNPPVVFMPGMSGGGGGSTGANITAASLGSYWDIIVAALQVIGRAAIYEEIYEWISGTDGFTNVDEMIMEFITGGTGNTDSGRKKNLKELGLDPESKNVGDKYQGWEIQMKTRYVKGRAKQEKKWYKPVRLWSPTERMAGSQQGRATSVEWSKMLRKAKRRSYRAGERKAMQKYMMYGKQGMTLVDM